MVFSSKMRHKIAAARRENRVKYGARCEAGNARSRGTLYFTVFAGFYVEACSENRVKYGVPCAGAVQVLVFAWFFAVFLAFYVKAC